MNVFTKEKQTDRYQKHTYGYQRQRDKSGAGNEHTHITIYKTYNQHGPTALASRVAPW